MVVLQLIIDTDGKVKNIKVVKSVPELDEAALQAIGQYVFSPGKKDGKAVKTLMIMPVQFKLR